MTETIEPKISEGFALSSQCELPHDLDLSAEVDDDILRVESIVAAMLSDKYNLSAEELAAFEELLDAPDIDPTKRHELLQTLWNIAVCLIDYQWENAATSMPPNSCGSISYERGGAASGSDDVVRSLDQDLNQDEHEAAIDGPGQKGSP